MCSFFWWGSWREWALEPWRAPRGTFEYKSTIFGAAKIITIPTCFTSLPGIMQALRHFILSRVLRKQVWLLSSLFYRRRNWGLEKWSHSWGVRALDCSFRDFNLSLFDCKANSWSTLLPVYFHKKNPKSWHKDNGRRAGLCSENKGKKCKVPQKWIITIITTNISWTLARCQALF